MGTAFWFTFFSSVIFATVSFIFSDSLARILFNFDNGGYYIRLITISAAIKAHSMVFYNLLMAREEARRYVTINVATLILTMLVTIYLVVFAKMGVAGILTAQIIAYAIEFAGLSAYLFRPLIFHYSPTAVKDMLNFSIPLIPLQVAAFVLSMSDRFFI